MSIDGVVHGKGLGSSKKHAKTEAARQTLEILIPDFKETLGEDIAGATNSSSTALNELPDVSFFDPYRWGWGNHSHAISPRLKLLSRF